MTHKSRFLLIMLAVFPVNIIISQTLFEGKLTYIQKTNTGLTSDILSMDYHKGNDFVSFTPELKTKVIYNSHSQEIVSIQTMMEIPIISRKQIEINTDMSPVLFDDSIFNINGHFCLRFEKEVDNEMIKGKTSVWIDTSYKIPYNYGTIPNLRYGLVVKTESEVTVKGIKMCTIKELQDIYYGNVDSNMFVLPDQSKSIIVLQDTNGNIVYRNVDSTKINQLLSPCSGKIETINDAIYTKKAKKGYVIIDFGATWCGPCKLLEPRLETVSRSFRKKINFFKMDLDESPLTAKMMGVSTVPTVILLKDGVEVDRFVGGHYSQEEISKWILLNIQ